MTVLIPPRTKHWPNELIRKEAVRRPEENAYQFYVETLALSSILKLQHAQNRKSVSERFLFCFLFVFWSPLLRCPLCELLLWVVSCQVRSTWCLGARENRYAPHCRLSEVVPYAVLPLKQLLSDVCFPSSVGSSVWSGPSSLHTQCSLSVPDLKPTFAERKSFTDFRFCHVT